MSDLTTRTDMAALLNAALADGIQVYETPAEQIKAPAVVIGSLSWTPSVMASLETVDVDVTLTLLWTRTTPTYAVDALENLALDVAKALLPEGFICAGYSDERTETVGNVEYLAGTIEVRQRARSTT